MRVAFAVLRGDPRGRVAALLGGATTAVGVLLVLWLVGAPAALDARESRAAWRSATAGEGQGALTVATTRDEFGGRWIERFDVTSAGGAVPVPAGIPRLPGPGEVLLSPALAALVREVPAERLGRRFPGAVVGEVGGAALRFPDELVAIVGHPHGTVAGTPRRDLVGAHRPDAADVGMLSLLSKVGLVVLVVPCLVLVASAGRLTAARRARRLAALRVAGATPGQALRLTAVEAAVGAVPGSVLGAVAAGPASRWAAEVPWGGGTWFPADFAPSPLTAGAVAVLASALLVGAAVLGHVRQRTVRRDAAPLGPGRWGLGRRGTGRWGVAGRLLFALVAAGVFGAGVVAAEVLGPRHHHVAVLVGLAGVVLALVVAGPVVTALVGRVVLRGRRGAWALLVGRRLATRPVAAFRASAGVLVAVFTGSLALTMLPVLEAEVRFDDGQWRPGAVVAHGVDGPWRVDVAREVVGPRWCR
ncbi:FtsX-like permease family protein [Actinosynnema sp. NPDC047251]|uniref:ABC3 transporter permease C-terminal domain-containing protein n=1 Tax=Saccharothrix espanaensis (strain ATCC 51144 / DSM 44229 / JCM 9112 / NBRC 15066 / NRRL 15764) TaxID=1179773 RepID=K0JZF7_SACES|nr:FtsX-like permease family protein [Saccharothrix espanaensis]CCH29643.1 hypothetical protein BN6_23250 [Saccharothrix espanaensis DSM 44229]